MTRKNTVDGDALSGLFSSTAPPVERDPVTPKRTSRTRTPSAKKEPVSKKPARKAPAKKTPAKATTQKKKSTPLKKNDVDKRELLHTNVGFYIEQADWLDDQTMMIRKNSRKSFARIDLIRALLDSMMQEYPDGLTDCYALSYDELVRYFNEKLFNK